MKKVLCLIAALTLALSSLGCTKIRARMEIKAANEAYQKEDYAGALPHYQKARQIDPSFPDLDRLVGYSEIGLYVPDDKSANNEKHADRAILELNGYLQKRPDDRIARDALINMYLNANRTSQAIDYFRNYLTAHPADLEAVKSIATLYAKQGDFNESLNWYQKITLLDSKNPEAFYIFGVVCYEKVSKNPPADVAQKMDIINRGKDALQHAIDMKSDYAEAMAYLNLLWRQQALVDALTDPVKAQADVAQADVIRNKTMQIFAARKAAGAKKS
ncbi:MAG TPA: tetratricopeptide repeat protein [Thermoanaerobaculia bacterium]|jgi:tetratricopeptide (TPR) repeat protein|nr:tetratricopeptide repeat protein [Thermoanaerobaculia bacterium]